LRIIPYAVGVAPAVDPVRLASRREKKEACCKENQFQHDNPPVVGELNVHAKPTITEINY
jgi:hypothetical protein